MTAVGDARKRQQETQAPLSQPIPAPVDSGAIGRLNEALAAHGLIYDHRCYPAYECECGWHGAIGDNGGPEDGTKDNADAWRAHVAAGLAAIVREHTDRALAEVESVVASRREAFLSSPNLDPAWIAGWHSAVDDVTNSVRAARQELDPR